MSNGFDDFADIFKDMPSLESLVQARVRLHRFSVIPQTRVVTIPHAFVLQGEAGKTIDEKIQVQNYFKLESLFLSGPGAYVRLFCGAQVVFPAPIPSWAFSAWIDPSEFEVYETCAKLVGTKFETPDAVHARDLLRLIRSADATVSSARSVSPGMQITITAEFTESRRIEGVLFGKGLQG